MLCCGLEGNGVEGNRLVWCGVVCFVLFGFVLLCCVVLRCDCCGVLSSVVLC